MIRALMLIFALTIGAWSLVACSGDDDSSSGEDETPQVERTRAPDTNDDDADANADDDDSPDSGDLEDHEEELRETVPAAYKAIFTGGAVEAYRYASDDFKDKCSLSDFTGVIALVKVFLGDLDEDDIEVEVTDVRFEDGKAYVTATGTIEGEDFEPDEGDDDFSDFWVYEDGAWKLGTDDEDPCDTSFDSTSSDDNTPASGPGSSRNEPAAIGEPIEVGDLRITVIEADTDGASLLETLSEFPSTPVPGRRVVLARVMVEHVGGDNDETIQVYESDYKITGSGNIVYDSFSDDTSCGFLEDTLEGEMFPGGSLEGNVCFQVPEDETRLLLIAEPSFSFGDEGRRYFALE